MRYIIAVLLTSNAALAEVPKVVTDIPPVHSIVAMVMGDLGTPELLLAPGADEHDFQLKPSQMGAVADADLLVWVGPELTPWLDSALDARGEGGALLTLFDDAGTYKINYFVSALGEDHDHVEEGHDHDEAEDHAESEGEEGHDDHDHSHAAGSIDPHVWLDPSTAQYWTGRIAPDLSRLAPESPAPKAAKAEPASARLATAEAEAKVLLDPVKDRPFVSFHDAYGYYITYFGLTSVGSISIGDASTPGAARLSALRAELEAGSVACIFPEAQHDAGLVEQIVDGTGVKIGGTLDPVGSTIEQGPEAYPTLLLSIATTLSECLSG